MLTRTARGNVHCQSYRSRSAKKADWLSARLRPRRRWFGCRRRRRRAAATDAATAACCDGGGGGASAWCAVRWWVAHCAHGDVCGRGRRGHGRSAAGVGIRPSSNAYGPPGVGITTAPFTIVELALSSSLSLVPLTWSAAGTSNLVPLTWSARTGCNERWVREVGPFICPSTSLSSAASGVAAPLKVNPIGRVPPYRDLLRPRKRGRSP